MSDSESSSGTSGFSSKLDSYFHITERGSDVKTEIKGGIITFLAMFYILAVNPSILSAAAGPELFGQLVASTALAACVSCLLMGIYAKFPVALAPGMGINAFVAYTIVITMGFDYYQALLIVLISGIAFFFLTISGLRSKILMSIPMVMKYAITAGIGFFIVVVGLFNAGIIVHGTGSALALGNFADSGVFLSLICVAVTLALWFRNNWGAVLIGIIVTIIIGYIGGAFLGWDSTINGAQLIPGVGLASITGVVSMPDFGLFGSVFSNLTGFEATLWPAFIVSIISLLVVDMFDTTGTLVGIGHSAGILKADGSIEGNEKALQADSIATIFGAIAGTSTTTSFIESSTGISAGARTGLMAVVVGLLFLIALFFSPIFAIITPACTVGALFLVGLMMITSLKDVEWLDPVNICTVFITLFMMGLSGSITDGIALGALGYLIGMTVTGKAKEVSKVMWGLGVVFVVYFIITYWVTPLL